MLLILKIVIVPLIIMLVSLAGRVWGSRISGILAGLPIIMGPILVFLAIDHGEMFATVSAKAALAGVISIGLFCLIYALASRQANVWFSLNSSLLGFAASTLVLSLFDMSLIVTFIVVVTSLLIFLVLFPERTLTKIACHTSFQEIFLRMTAAAVLVLVITVFSDFFGPRLSGLLAPFPIAGTVLASFTHHNCGIEATRQLLDGFVRGLFGMAIFAFTFAFKLSSLGLWPTIIVGMFLAIVGSSITARLQLMPLKRHN